VLLFNILARQAQNSILARQACKVTINTRLQHSPNKNALTLKGLRERISLKCTLSQNGYGANNPKSGCWFESGGCSLTCSRAKRKTACSSAKPATTAKTKQKLTAP
jgi:hypothetical protein